MYFSKTFLILFSIFFIIFTKNINDNINKKLEKIDECEEREFQPNEENVKITGRYLIKENITWLIQSGSSIEFHITAYSAEIVFIGDSSIYQVPSLRPRFGVYIDDKLLFDYTANELKFIVQLFSGFFERTAKVKVKLLSENVYGGIGIKSINLCTGHDFQKYIFPEEKKHLNIEFIGDSITCAFGVDGKNQFEQFKTITEDSSKSYAYLVAQILEADYSVVCYSGHGIISGYSEGEKNINALVKDYYKQIGKNKNYPGDWDFNKHKNDIVFINLGANDNNYVKANPQERNEEFINGYYDFLKMVREANPDSIIICTQGLMACDGIVNLVEPAIKRFNDENNNKAYFFRSPPNDEKDGYGSLFHPSTITQKKLSAFIAEKIKEIYQNNKSR